MMKRKMIVTALTTILLLALYCIIFSFSDQDGETSGSVSLKVSKSCVELADKISNQNWTDAVKRQLAETFEHPIRRLAHFSEYACMGILVYILCRQWRERSRWLYLLTILWVFVSAVADEIHQSFVPGREASFGDVVLDTAGGLCGLILCVVFEVLYRRRQEKIQKGSLQS